MKTITLNNYNTMLLLHGNEATRSLFLKTIVVTKWPASGTLTLTVTDEKDVPIYSKHLTLPGTEGETIVDLNEKFVFYDHIAVHLVTEPANSPYEAEIAFE
ncbi:hypothetical protein [Pontibacter fetidus]|uniref:Uncharacterized protein n=1 Tax=Pontibacter fetidus TaxID=2700082 RepID=A0A6B2H6Y5_9BACT|nr:hypothetical protein [Pontibacter fetidus]NDK55660.1 hypothetical protein [Pontibacter fetidus]